METTEERINDSEVYKDVVGYEGLYKISNLGNIISLKRQAVHSSKNGYTNIKEKKLSMSKTPQGYLKVLLSKNGVKKTKLIHHMVAESFLNHINRSNFIVIDHVDENKTNNSVSNLQIINKSENMNKSIKLKKTDLETINKILSL